MEEPRDEIQIRRGGSPFGKTSEGLNRYRRVPNWQTGSSGRRRCRVFRGREGFNTPPSAAHGAWVSASLWRLIVRRRRLLPLPVQVRNMTQEERIELLKQVAEAAPKDAEGSTETCPMRKWFFKIDRGDTERWIALNCTTNNEDAEAIMLDAIRQPSRWF